MSESTPQPVSSSTELVPYVPHSTELVLYSPPGPAPLRVETLPRNDDRPSEDMPLFSEPKSTPLKVRGMSYTKIPVSPDQGSIIVAERLPSSKKMPRTDREPNPEQERPFAGQVNIRYQADEYGRTQTGVEFTQTGSVMDWGRLKPTSGVSKDVILHTDDGSKYWVRDGEILDLTRMEKGLFKRPEDLVIAQIGEERPPTAVISEGWQITPDFVTDVITKAEVKYKLAADTKENHEVFEILEPRGNDPFRAAEELLAKVQGIETPTRVYEPIISTTLNGLRERTQNMMGRAADMLHMAADLSLLATGKGRAKVKAAKSKAANVASIGFEATINKLIDVKEHYSEWKEKHPRITAEILGALAMSGTVLYEELKTSTSSDKPITLVDMREYYSERKDKRRKIASRIVGSIILGGTVLYEELKSSITTPSTGTEVEDENQAT